MKKCDEMREPKSCLNKALVNEPLFVLRGKDPVGAATVRHWATMAEGIHEPEKIKEALKLADQMCEGAIMSLIPKRRDKSPLVKPVAEPMTDVMIDLETLGRRPGCVVLSIGAVEFGPQGLGREFYAVLDVFGQKSLGLHEDPATLEWWNNQSEEAHQVLQQATSLAVPKFGLTLDLFNEWLSPIGFKRVKVWGNGADFDNAILSCLYGSLGLTPPWDFWNNRCYRTLKNLVPGPKLERSGTYHNALDDAKSQALHAVQLLKQL